MYAAVCNISCVGMWHRRAPRAALPQSAILSHVHDLRSGMPGLARAAAASKRCVTQTVTSMAIPVDLVQLVETLLDIIMVVGERNGAVDDAMRAVLSMLAAVQKVPLWQPPAAALTDSQRFLWAGPRNAAQAQQQHQR